jgi:hypothetical protein
MARIISWPPAARSGHCRVFCPYARSLFVSALARATGGIPSMMTRHNLAEETRPRYWSSEKCEICEISETSQID